ncbi:Shedu immune nuclease family protein [Acidovorax sp.]|uniref:Shedu immune nuclease family protein n=1 Tax=Acidovorax sp. TaxID=1872122 RepID=UPI0025BD344C|nr:Shedu immune nuclease family protein [Acidovorax sp.]
MRIEKGDRVVMPSALIKLSFNPLKSTGQMSRSGLAWFAQMINFERLPTARDDVMTNLEQLRNRCNDLVEGSPLFSDIDFSEPGAGDLAYERAAVKDQNTMEWWAMSTAIFLDILKEAVEAEDIHLAIWAMGCAERCRAMLVFKENLEEPLMMAQAARRIIDILGIWDTHAGNSLEAFWQTTFREHSYALSQAFSAPMILIGEGTYVGGMTVDRKSAKYADFLYSHESSKEAMLVEIKTPKTSLLGRAYRGTFQPSAELSGAVMQALDYRKSLAIDHGAGITAGTGHQLSAFAPRCMVLIGNGNELNSIKKRNAFEMFRSNLRDVEVVTYDELFRKLDMLASVFGLKRAKGSNC